MGCLCGAAPGGGVLVWGGQMGHLGHPGLTGRG